MKIELAHDPASARVAREVVRDACAPVLPDVEDVVLCASELISNALLHGKPPVELQLTLSEECVRVEVRDAGATTVERRLGSAPDTLSGRGLTLVDALATRWGADSTDTGTVVWFEMDRRDPGGWPVSGATRS